MQNRLGVGYKNQFLTELPAVAVQYYPSNELGMSGAMGIDTTANNSKFGLMFKLHKIIFPENNLNFYMGAGAGILSITNSGTNNSGFELNGFVGAEFYFPQLESLGISFEAGVAVTSLSSGVTFRTFGDHPLRAGIIFYF